jgi:hypothetical protein
MNTIEAPEGINLNRHRLLRHTNASFAKAVVDVDAISRGWL